MKRLLFIAHRVPYPPDKGERLRAFHEIRTLAGRFRVTLATLAHDARDRTSAPALKEWCEKVLVAPAGGHAARLRGAWSLLNGGSVTEGYFHSRRLLRTVRAEADRNPFDRVFAYSSGVLPWALAVPAAAYVCDLVDADSAKWEAYADRARPPKRWVYRREARGVQALERLAVERCDATVVVSRREAEALGPDGEKVHVIGCGVDTDYFRPATAGAAAGDGPHGPPSLVFTGTMSYPPNIDGVVWFVRKVWPGLKAAAPDLTMQIVGRDPAPAVRRLARTPGVSVTAAVPDVRPYLAAATVVVAPLRIARGVQNKVLEAMAAGRAVVASAPAAEGLGVETGRDLLRADSPRQWRDTILTLLRNPARRDALARAARACVVERYTWSAQLAPLVRLCESPTRAHRGEPVHSEPKAP